MYRGQVSAVALTNNHRVLYADGRESNGPRGERAWLTQLYICM